MDPIGTQLILDELQKLIDKFDARLAKWETEDAEREASRGVPVATQSVAVGADVVADDWGGLFDGEGNCVTAGANAGVVADNWGGLFDEICKPDGACTSIRIHDGLISSDRDAPACLTPAPIASESLRTVSKLLVPPASAELLTEHPHESALVRDSLAQRAGKFNILSGGEFVSVGVGLQRLHYDFAADNLGLLRCVCLGSIERARHAILLGGYDGSLDDDPEFGIAQFDVSRDRADGRVGQAPSAAAALHADAVGAAGGGLLFCVVAAGSAQATCSTICPARDLNLADVPVCAFWEELLHWNDDSGTIPVDALEGCPRRSCFMKVALAHHGEASPLLLLWVHRTMHARVTSVLDDSAAPPRHQSTMHQVAHLAAKLTLDFVHFHALLLVVDALPTLDVSKEHAIQSARKVFEVLSLPTDIFCNVSIDLELSHMSLGVNQHHSWPPPDELRSMMRSDAGPHPLPWLSFNMVEKCSVRCYCDCLWKPPWSIHIRQQISSIQQHISSQRASCQFIMLHNYTFERKAQIHSFLSVWACSSVVLCYHLSMSIISMGGTDGSDGVHLAHAVVMLVTTRIAMDDFSLVAISTVRPKSNFVVSRLQQPWFSSVRQLLSGAAKLQPMPWLFSIQQAIICRIGCSQPKLKSDLMTVTSMDSITPPAVWPLSSILLIQEHTQQRHAGVCRTSLLQLFNPGNTEHGRQLIGGSNGPVVDCSNESEAEVVISSNKGGTLIHVAAVNGHPKILWLLLQHKADYNAGNPATAQFILLSLATRFLAIQLVHMLWDPGGCFPCVLVISHSTGWPALLLLSTFWALPGSVAEMELQSSLLQLQKGRCFSAHNSVVVRDRPGRARLRHHSAAVRDRPGRAFHQHYHTYELQNRLTMTLIAYSLTEAATTATSATARSLPSTTTSMCSPSMPSSFAQRKCGGRAVFPPGAGRGLWGLHTDALRVAAGCFQHAVAVVEHIPAAHVESRVQEPSDAHQPQEQWKITAAA